MITTGTKQKHVERFGDAAIDAQAYHIDTDNIVHLTQILRDMYSRPHEAVAREYVANAVDAHVEAGCVDRPIRVSLPHASSSLLGDNQLEFVVRDFGLGLDVEDTKRLLFGYGSSGEAKRLSNDHIGGFGVGCKCAFAISGQFTYRIFHGGLCRTWRCWLDEDDMGQSELVTEAPSSEPTGIEVSIPVDAADVRKFDVSVMRSLFQYLHVPVDLIQGKAAAVRANVESEARWTGGVKCTISDGREFSIKWRVLKKSREHTPGAHCIIGGFRYPLDLTQLPGLPQRASLYGNLDLYLPIGYVPLAPNREAIKYTPRTINLLTRTVKEVTQDVARRAVAEKGSLLEQFRGIRLLDGFTNSVKYPAGLCESGFDFGKAPLKKAAQIATEFTIRSPYPSTEGVFTVQPVNHFGYGGAPSFEQVSAWQLGPRIPHHCMLAVLDVPGMSRIEIGNRVLAAVLNKFAEGAPKSIDRKEVLSASNSDTYVTCLVVNASGNYVEVADELRKHPAVVDGSIQMLPVDTNTPVETLVKPKELAPPSAPQGHMPVARAEIWRLFQEQARYGRGKSASGRSTIKAHSRKFVQLKEDKDGRSRNSDWWSACDAKDVNAGVYVVINQFLPCSALGGECGTLTLSWLREIAADEEAKRLGLVPKKIYGIRVRDATSVKQDPDFIELRQFFVDKFAELIKARKISADHLAWWHAQNSPKGVGNDARWESMKRLLRLGASPDLARTKFHATSKKILRRLDQPLSTLEEKAYELFDSIHTGNDSLWGTRSFADALQLDDKTPEGRYMRRVTNRAIRCGMGVKLDEKINPATSPDLFAEWLALIRDKYPILGTWLMLNSSPAGHVGGGGIQYKIDDGEWVRYIKNVERRKRTA